MGIMTKLMVFVERVAYALHAIGAVLTMVVMLLTVSNALGRTLASPIGGVPEIGKLTLVLIIFFQMPYVFVRGRHVAANFLEVHMAAYKYARISLVVLVVGIVAFALMTYASYEFAVRAIQLGEFEIAGGMMITVVPSRVMVTVGSSWCLVYLTLLFLLRISQCRRPECIVEAPSHEIPRSF